MNLNSKISAVGLNFHCSLAFILKCDTDFPITVKVEFRPNFNQFFFVCDLNKYSESLNLIFLYFCPPSKPKVQIFLHIYIIMSYVRIIVITSCSFRFKFRINFVAFFVSLRLHRNLFVCFCVLFCRRRWAALRRSFPATSSRTPTSFSPSSWTAFTRI